LPDRGGVAFLGNTRWGWVTSSYLIEKKFIEYAYAEDSRHLAVAEALSKIYYPNKRDLNYGHNLFGDPELKMWLYEPERISLTAPDYIDLDSSGLVINVFHENGEPAANIDVCIWKPGELYHRAQTDSYGGLELQLSLQSLGDLYVTASGADMIPAMDTIIVTYQSGLNDDSFLPEETHLYNNYPNPFNVATNIQFSLKISGDVLLTVYDINGRLVKTLIDDSKLAGKHIVNWDGRNNYGKEAASGTYFYSLKTADKNIVKKMIMLK